MIGDRQTILKTAERRIQNLLIELEEDLQCKIESVEVDTRNFANLAVEIFLKENQ